MKSQSNVSMGVLFLVLCFGLLAGTSCNRRITTTTHTRDTIFVEKKDIVRVPADTAAILKAYGTVDSVFIEIEKDCPQIKNKIPALKEKVKDICTIEYLTGGSIKVWFPELKDSLRIDFKGNTGIAYGSGKDMEITDTTVSETVVQETWFKRLINNWALILITAITFFIIGRLLKFAS